MATYYSNRPIVTDGLVLYLDAANSKSYPGSGTDWVNIADTSMTGSIISATYSTNNLGNFNFDETNDYVVISSGSESLNIGTNHTWVWWLRFPTGVTGSAYQYIYSHNSIDNVNSLNLLVGESNAPGSYAGAFFAYYNDSGSTTDVRSLTSNEVTSSIADTQWHMVTFVKSGWSYTTHTLYVDNTEKYTFGNNTSEKSITKCVPTGDLNVGRRTDANSQRYFGGDMAILMVYKDKALTEQEIQQNFNALRGRFGI